jgi:ATP-dependent Lon protease
VRILNRPSPPAFSESVKYAEANLYSRSAELVGDRNPREHDFSVQLRAYDAAKAGQSLGVASLMAMCSVLINRSLRGGLVVVGGLNLGGSLDQLHNAIDVVELAVEKGASLVLMPVAARKQLIDLSDEMATKVNVLFYGDVREAFVKAIAD